MRLGLPLTAAYFGLWWALLPAVTVTLAVRVQEVAPANVLPQLLVPLAAPTLLTMGDEGGDDALLFGAAALAGPVGAAATLPIRGVR